MGFGNYLKAAFVNRWNLLAFLGAAAFALLSGRADVFLPVVLAAEIGYVGLLASRPRFQSYVDAQAAKAQRVDSSMASRQSLQYILRALPKDLLQRFQSLRTQCLDLRQIALNLRRPGMTTVDAPLEQLQTSGLDRLLWVYLRLLYTQFALATFLKKTTVDQIQASIDRLEKQIARLPADEGDSRAQRMRAAMQDNLETNRSRLSNLNKALENAQFIELEIDRLENKIRSLSEMAVNRQEPEFISSEVDHVASSMVDTERTMNELQFATGLGVAETETPELLRAETAIVQK